MSFVTNATITSSKTMSVEDWIESLHSKKFNEEEPFSLMELHLALEAQNNFNHFKNSEDRANQWEDLVLHFLKLPFVKIGERVKETKRSFTYVVGFVLSMIAVLLLMFMDGSPIMILLKCLVLVFGATLIAIAVERNHADRKIEIINAAHEKFLAQVME